MSSHEHRFEFTTDPEALAHAARDLDWPADADERIQQVQRCAECGQLNRVAWVSPHEQGYVPGWLSHRLSEYARGTRRDD